MRKYLAQFLLLALTVLNVNAQTIPYKNPTLSVQERTKDLLSRMTIEEKVGQLLCPLGWEMYERNGQKIVCSEKFKKAVKDRHVGMLWAVYRADPWTRKTLDNGLAPELAAATGNALQRYVIENTRLGIPLFLAEESPHGHMAIGTTVFPTGIGLASTWSKNLLTEVGEVISKEIRLQGAHIAYGPVLDLAREPRWSRVEETFGEDPALSGELAKAIIRGEGAGNLTNKNSVITTLKHFIAYGISEGGQNGNPSIVGSNELHQYFLPPFKKAVDAGALSVMTSYNSVDGTPCTSNKNLLTDLLQKEWGFRGFSVSDLYSIEGICQSHRVAKSIDEAAIKAVEAGTNVDLGGDAYFTLIQSVKNGLVPQSVIDSATSRVLRLKFEMGLFENPYVDLKLAKKTVRNPGHIAVARKAALESIVLLENKGILPLRKDIKRIALVGPNAHNRYNMLGDYTAPQEDSNVKTVLDGLQRKFPATTIDYVKGCNIKDTTVNEISKACSVAREADVVVAVVGGSSARDFKTSYQQTGAAITSDENISDMECGEGFDRSTLDLLGRQMELLKALKKTGKPLIVIYIEGRPLNMNWASENADALLSAWYPGQEGGVAIAEVLAGDYNPAGRLAVSVPRSVGQLPVYYNKKNPGSHNYVETTAKPLYSFGYGLSYSNFDYSELSILKKYLTSVEVKFNVRNSGNYDGDEVVQLYLRDDYASTVQPLMQLKHFDRIFIKKGETKEVSFILTKDDLSIVNQYNQRVIEPGSFTVMIGGSSETIKLKQSFNINF